MFKNLRDQVGEEVILNCWVQDFRSSGKITFLVLRDMYDVYQGVIKNQKFDLPLESFIEVKGIIKPAQLKSKEFTIKDREIHISEFKLISKASTLPIPVVEKGVQTTLEKRLNYRYIDLKKIEKQAIFKIQSTIINAFRNFFYNNGFIEIQPPGIIATSTEGGTDLFEVKYFEKPAYLAQSPQLYKQLGAITFGRVFSTSPVWRAEKHNTTRHLNEVRQMDIEVAMADDFEVMKYIEEVVAFIVKEVKKHNKKELEILERDIKFNGAKYMSYDEAIEFLKNKGHAIKHGEDLDNEAEKLLCEAFPHKIVFVHSWPISLKPFYIMPKDKEKGISAGFDALFEGIEISSGGQRIHIPELLEEMIKAKGLNPKSFDWYIDAFRYGAPPHSGWSIGLERLTMTLLGIKNIREACIFPRDRKRLTP